MGAENLMAFPEDRLSSEVVLGTWLDPDDRTSDLLTDYEDGPIAVTDTSEGLRYQPWRLDYVSPDFVLTPETTGTPVTALTGVTDVVQCSFAFDGNARPTIAYTVGTTGYLYWYDTVAADFVTTNFGTIVTPSLMNDDKRPTQQQLNDVLFHYTRDEGGSYNLYQRRQRDRYGNEILLASGVYPNIKRNGMNNALRVQIELST